jgi:hypothetical protein
VRHLAAATVACAEDEDVFHVVADVMICGFDLKCLRSNNRITQ